MASRPGQKAPLSPWNGKVQTEFKTPSRRQQPSMKSLLSYDPTATATPVTRRNQHKPVDHLQNLTADPAPVGAPTPRFQVGRDEDAHVALQDTTPSSESLHKRAQAEATHYRELAQSLEHTLKNVKLELSDTHGQQAKLKKAAKEAKSEAAQARGQAEQYGRKYQQLKQQHTQLKHAHHQQAKAADEAKHALVTLKQTLATLTAEYKHASSALAAEQQAAEAASAHASKVIASLKTQLATSEEARAAAETSFTLTQEELQRLRHLNDQLQSQADQAMQAKTKAEQARSRRSMAFHAEQNRRVQVEKELDARKHGSASQQAHAQQQAEALVAKLEATRKQVAHLEVKMAQEQQGRAELEDTLQTMAEEDRRRRHRRQQKVKAMMQDKQGIRPQDCMEQVLADNLADLDATVTELVDVPDMSDDDDEQQEGVVVDKADKSDTNHTTAANHMASSVKVDQVAAIHDDGASVIPEPVEGITADETFGVTSGHTAVAGTVDITIDQHTTEEHDEAVDYGSADGSGLADVDDDTYTLKSQRTTFYTAQDSSVDADNSSSHDGTPNLYDDLSLLEDDVMSVVSEVRSLASGRPSFAPGHVNASTPVESPLKTDDKETRPTATAETEVTVRQLLEASMSDDEYILLAEENVNEGNVDPDEDEQFMDGFMFSDESDADTSAQ
eukprot:TRINITY_DN6952_c0_g1_i1.p1 TRINITY_DN6952_c0_g1~~TRINITY_DN6952_c0_g1_i1.p1  ORF type:complete len:673 (+),score=272.12 TRINITY_DN6952_c0_g1_i1:43-2061(+)